MKDKKRKPIKMVALDLDGTTLNHYGRISERTVAAFKEAMERGVHIVVSTGRTFASLPEQLFDIEGLEYVVTSNGAHITKLATKLTAMERIYEEHIGALAAEEIASLLRGSGISVEIFIDGHAYIDKVEYEGYEKYGSSYRDTGYILATRNPIEDLYGYMLKHKEQIENISLNFEFMDEREEWRRRLSQISGVTLTTSFIHNIEIGGANTSKAQALRFLMEKLEITADELLACGDSPNDIEMIRLAAVGVAMANAEETTKAAAGYITDSNADDGVAKAIEKFVLG